MSSPPAAPPPKKLKVLSLGYSRTGTSSMQASLRRLGFVDCYHGFDILDARDRVLWTKAVNFKFRGGKEQGHEALSKAEWEELLGRCEAVTDGPCCLFWEELVEMFPDAKIILVERPVDTWFESYRNSIWDPVHSRAASTIHLLEPLIGATPISLARNILDATITCSPHGDKPNSIKPNFDGANYILKSPPPCPLHAKKTYLAHYARIRVTIPKEKILEFKLSDGWGPLCEFLDKDVPKKKKRMTKDGEEVEVEEEEEFPRLNDAKIMAERTRASNRESFWKSVNKGALVLGPVLVGVGLWYFGFSTR